MFKVVWNCAVLGDDFSDIVSNVIGENGELYDFDNMASLNENSITFKKALDTLLVRALVRACSYKINQTKEKKDFSFTSMLTEKKNLK
jgi:hypothetical protein